MTINASTPLSYDEINQVFRPSRLPLPDRTFGLGLVLGGTVSAGAFTAGVLDYLVEALDAWEKVKSEEKDRPEEQRTMPPHSTRLEIVTGSSGGGVCGAILARALAYPFPHVQRKNRNDHNEPTGSTDHNPFWTLWVEGLRFSDLLENDVPEFQSGNPNTLATSVLSQAPIDEAAQKIVDYGFVETDRRAVCETPRQWVAPQLQLILALTNLRGIPYSVGFGALKQYFVNHADHARFRINTGQPDNIPKSPHELMVLGPNDSRKKWTDLAEYAKATGAFPGGFPARQLIRDITDYRFRAVLVPEEEDGHELIPLHMDAEDLAKVGIADTGPYAYMAVDAGATNNAPVELARTHLSGTLERNSRDPHKADRAIVLIDPFADAPQCGPGAPKSVLEMLGALVLGLVRQTRYETRDLLLALDEKVFSRFMLTASRKIKVQGKERHAIGGDALCSSRMGAFFGFIDEEYSKHDYFLGRQNCKEFLRNEFVVAHDNECLRYPAHLIDKYKVVTAEGQVSVPIIPLTDLLRDTDEGTPVWPSGQFKPDDFKERIKDRAEAVINNLLIELQGKPDWYDLINHIRNAVIRANLSDWVASRVVDWIKKAKAGGTPSHPLPPL